MDNTVDIISFSILTLVFVLFLFGFEEILIHLFKCNGLRTPHIINAGFFNVFNKVGFKCRSFALLHHNGFNVIDFANLLLSWMSTTVTNNFDDKRIKAFDLKYIEIIRTKQELDALPSPKVIFTTSPTMDYGYAHDIIGETKFNSNPNNMENYYEIAVELNTERMLHWKKYREIANEEQIKKLDSIWKKMKDRIRSSN